MHELRVRDEGEAGRDQAEWRSFADEQGGESRARTGMPTSITSFDMGLSTVIGSSNRDASGSSLSGAMKHTMDRVRVWDKRSEAANSFDRNLRQAFNEMKMFAEKLAVRDEVMRGAAYIYRKAVERGVTEGQVHHPGTPRPRSTQLAETWRCLGP